jgi:hypothetical protein
VTFPYARAKRIRKRRHIEEGLKALGMKPYGDLANKIANVTGVYIPEGIDGERVRRALLEEFNIEIGTSFGPLAGRIRRIGTMGYNARPDCVYQVLGALEAVMHAQGYRGGRGDRAGGLRRDVQHGAHTDSAARRGPRGRAGRTVRGNRHMPPSTITFTTTDSPHAEMIAARVLARACWKSSRPALRRAAAESSTSPR